MAEPDEFVQGPPPKGAQAVSDEFVQGPPPKGVKPLAKGETWTSKSSDDDIIKALGYDPKTVKDSKFYTPGMFSKMTTDPGSPVSKATSGPLFSAFKGLMNVGAGIGQIASRTMIGMSDADRALVDAGQKFMNMEFQRAHTQLGNEKATGLPKLALGASEFAGEAIPSLAVGGPSIGAAKLFSSQGAKQLGKIAATGALTAITQPVNMEPGASLMDYLGVKTKQGLGAAAIAPIASVAIEKVAPPVAKWIGDKTIGKLKDALAGTKLGNRLGIATELNPKYAGAPALSEELDRAGVPHTVGDITSDPAVMSHEAAMARKDPRMMDLRVEQNQKATQYSHNIVDDLKAAVKQTGWKGLEDLQAAVGAGGKRAGEASALIEALKNVGDDTRRIVQKSGNLNLLLEKLKADQLYDKAEAISRLYGPVKQTGYIESLKHNISSLRGNNAKDQSQLPYLDGLLDDALKGRNNGFGGVRETRTAINGKIEGLNQPGVVVADVNASKTALKNVVGALESDLDTYAKGHSSGLRNAWKDATDHYKENVVPYKAQDMASPLADTDPMKLVTMFHGKNSYEQARMFRLLDPKGQAALRASVIEDAINAGEKTQRGAMAPTMSTARAASALEKLASNGTMDVAFPPGEQKWAVRGLARILRVVDKSDNIAWIPPTGEVMDRIGASVKGDTTVLGVGEKAVNWLNRERLLKLYMDPKGRALLQRAASLPDGSPVMKTIVERDFPKLLGLASATDPYEQPGKAKE